MGILDFLNKKLNKNNIIQQTSLLMFELKPYIQYIMESQRLENLDPFSIASISSKYIYHSVNNNIMIMYNDFDFGICINDMYFEISLYSSAKRLSIFLDESFQEIYLVKDDKKINDSFGSLEKCIQINISNLLSFLNDCKNQEKELLLAHGKYQEKLEDERKVEALKQQRLDSERNSVLLNYKEKYENTTKIKE